MSKPEAVLTIAGDATQLERASKQAQNSTEKLAQAFDEVSQAAKRTDTAMAGVDGASARLSQIAGRGGADFRAYRSDLDGVGDGFNDIEDRAMGAGNIINGFQDVMKGGSQGAATFAMGLSDLAAGVRYTVVPSLQDGVKGAKGFIDKLGGLKGAAGIAAGAAGIGAVLVAIDQFNKRQQQMNIERMTSEFLAAGDSAEQMGDVIQTLSGQGFKEFFGTFDRLAHTNREAAERFVDQAEAAGLAKSQIEGMRETLHTLSAAEEQAARDTEDLAAAHDRAVEAVSNLHDKLREGISPIFDYQAAITSNQEALVAEAEATQAVTDAIAEFGAGSPEAVQAQRDLEAAHRDVINSAFDLSEAEDQLQSALQDGRVTAGELDGVLRVLQDRGYTSAEAMDFLRRSIDNLPTNKTINIVTRQSTIIAGSRNVPLASGGVVYAAQGFMARGSDTVPAMLTPGEMVLNSRQQANLFDMINRGGGGGGTLRLVIDSGPNPVDRMLADMLRRIVRVEHGGDVQAALGYSR